ncbi:WD repeat-containing protein 73 [Chionoecetes opilio]|uniref:WD repeat-containing protein 73 n=1 Tax=Chionoecetes opilio TaxID=41210 RepID=A0A8J4XWM2_CHIOP|nr:WD repeat-containing protein 73 [Chionoecetes opilio]
MEVALGPDGESDDEWFFDSITRYDDLLMYDVHGDISCSTFYDGGKLLLGISRGSVHELWLLSVPDKLLAGRSAGLVNNRDFHLVAAGYTAGSVKKAVRVGSSVVVAEEGGVYLYCVPEPGNASDVISLSSTLKSSVAGEAVLAVSGSQVYAGNTLFDLTLMDLSSEKTLGPVMMAKGSQRNREISEVVCVGNKLFICSKNEGSVLICDPRTDSLIQEVQVQDTRGLWTMDASQEGDCVALGSSWGSVSVHDVRNSGQKMYSHNQVMESDKTGKVTLHFSPSDPLLSVSGFDKTVEIFNYKGGKSDSKVFRHDGHRGESVQLVVNHLWHPTVGQGAETPGTTLLHECPPLGQTVADLV